ALQASTARFDPESIHVSPPAIPSRPERYGHRPDTTVAAGSTPAGGTHAHMVQRTRRRSTKPEIGVRFPVWAHQPRHLGSLLGASAIGRSTPSGSLVSGVTLA